MVQKALTSINLSSVIIQGQIYTIQSRIHRFRTDPSCRVVLLSTQKNASGVNLTEASHIILLDSLNASKEEARHLEEQAIGRAVRLGQTRQVEVRRFIIRNTIEHDFYLRNIGVPKYSHLQAALDEDDGNGIEMEDEEEEIGELEGGDGGGGIGGNGGDGEGDGEYLDGDIAGSTGLTDANHEPSPMVI